MSSVGSMLVEASSKTVYLLTADNETRLLCEDTTGCTKVCLIFLSSGRRVGGVRFGFRPLE